MNKENAKDYLPLVQALAEGKLQFKKMKYCFCGQYSATTYEWEDVDTLPENLEAICPSSFRIKPEPKKQWCRMYLVKGAIGNTGEFFYSAIALNGHIRELENVEKSPIFVRWLTDRIEYELPEGDA